MPRARAVFEAAARDDPPRGRIVNDLLDATAARPRLDPDAEGRFQLHFHGPDDGYVRGWQAGLARASPSRMAATSAGGSGCCDAPGCGPRYVDGSKNGTRRFCSARCQSRVKAAAHRARAR